MAIQGGFTNSGRMKRVENRGEGKGRSGQMQSQKTARRGKEAFFNEQCLVIEDNNKRGKIRDLFRKIVNLNRAFRPKDGHNKE